MFLCLVAQRGPSKVCFFLSAAFLESCRTVMRLLCSLTWRLQICGPKGQCESPLTLAWGPWMPLPDDGLLRLLSFFGSSELASASPAAQEDRAHPLLGSSLSLMQEHGTAGLPTVPHSCRPGLHQERCPGRCERAILPPCTVGLWPTAGGVREQNHLCTCGVGWPRPSVVSAVVLCFQTSFWELQWAGFSEP